MEVIQNTSEVENSDTLRFRNTVPAGRNDKVENATAEWFECTKTLLNKIVSNVDQLHVASSATNPDSRSRRFEASNDMNLVEHRIENYRISLTKDYDDQMKLVRQAAQTLDLARDVATDKPPETNSDYMKELKALLSAFETSSAGAEASVHSTTNKRSCENCDLTTKLTDRLDFMWHELISRLDQIEKRQEIRFANIESMLTMIQGPSANLHSRFQRHQKSTFRNENNFDFSDHDNKRQKLDDRASSYHDHQDSYVKKETGAHAIDPKKLIQEVRAQLVQSTEFPYNLIKQVGKHYPYDHKCPFVTQVSVLRQQDDGTVKYRSIEAMYIHDLSHSIIGSELVYDQRPQPPREPTLEYSYQFPWMEMPNAVQLRGKFKFQWADEHVILPIQEMEVWVGKQLRNSIFLGQDFVQYIRLVNHETSTVTVGVPDCLQTVTQSFKYFIKGRKQLRRLHGFFDETVDKYIMQFQKERDAIEKMKKQEQQQQKTMKKSRKRNRRGSTMNLGPVQGTVQRIWNNTNELDEKIMQANQQPPHQSTQPLINMPAVVGGIVNVRLPPPMMPPPMSVVAEQTNGNGEMDIGAFAHDAVEQAEEFVRKVWNNCHFHALPQWLQDNDYLHTGHRPPLNSFWACFQSIFRVHTETVNIWTHLLGCIGFMGIAAYFLAKSSSEIRAEEKLLFMLYFGGTIVCLGLSCLFHTVHCHSEWVGRLFSKLDYCGIAVLIMVSFVPWLHYGFYCHLLSKIIYTCIVLVLGLSSILVSFWEKFSEPQLRPLRAGTFIVFGLSGVIPALHYAYVEGWFNKIALASLGWLVLMGALYIVGAVIYAMRIPERFFPGKCDIWFQSHQIFHVFVIVAAFVHYHGITEMAMYRMNVGACPNDMVLED